MGGVASNKCFILRLPSPSWFSRSTLAKRTQDDDISFFFCRTDVHEAIRMAKLRLGSSNRVRLNNVT